MICIRAPLCVCIQCATVKCVRYGFVLVDGCVLACAPLA